ncbi:hypothetical protein ABC270_00185 [Curtobacterium sp. 1P10AnD]|uniref:hypothetical protein n=1 Tax=Curtobacterium sp. 1P10AnD TaxID=3132283 RepID=UPI0039A2B788
MSESIARPAVSSDRAAAVTGATSLSLDDQDRIVFASPRGERIKTARLVHSWFLDEDALPKRLTPTASNGAVLLKDTTGSLYLVPVDQWWMSPISIVTNEVALASSGLAALLDRFGTDQPIPGNLDAAQVLTPTNERRRLMEQRILVVVILLGLGAFSADVFGPIVVAIAGGPGTGTFGWLAAAAAAANALVVLVIAAGRRHRRSTPGGTVLRPLVGPSWFLSTASVSTDDHGLVLTDGQGITQRLATPDRHLGRDAVVRAVFVHDDDPRVLLIDGTDTLRAQLPLRTWAPAPEDARALEGLLQGLGVITSAHTDARNRPALALDEMRSRGVGPSSLMLRNAVGSVPAYPFLASSAFTTIVLVGAGSVRPGAASTLVTLVFAAIAVAVVTTIFVVESSSRLPVARIHPEQHGRPDRPQFARRQLTALGVPILGAAVAVFYITRGNPFSAVSILLLVLTVPLVSWLSFRRRRAERGRAPVGFGRWIVIGTPRGDE